ncbi:hypothetical protein [Intrasporangium mesophilum]
MHEVVEVHDKVSTLVGAALDQPGARQCCEPRVPVAGVELDDGSPCLQALVAQDLGDRALCVGRRGRRLHGGRRLGLERCGGAQLQQRAPLASHELQWKAAVGIRVVDEREHV